MTKTVVGAIIAAAGGLLLSLELYGLKLIQWLDSQNGSFRTHAISYTEEASVSLALYTAGIVAALGVALLIWGITEETKKRS